MKANEIVVGKTYRGKTGPDRRVVANKKGDIEYRKAGFPRESKACFCWCSTFAGWAKSVVDDGVNSVA